MGDGLVKLRKLVEEAIAAGDTRMAIEILSSGILRKHPYDLDSLLRRGELWASLGEHSGAMQDVARVLQIDPQCIRALWCRAVCLLEGDRPAAAEDELSKIIELEPRSLDARLRRGASRVLQGKWGAALEDYQAAIEIDDKCSVAKRGIVECTAKLSEQKLLEAKMAEEQAKTGGGARWWGRGGLVEPPTDATPKKTGPSFSMVFDPTGWAATGGRAKFTIDFTIKSGQKAEKKPPAKSGGDDVNY